LWMYL